MPSPEAAISVDNADQVTLLARWGRGWIESIAWSPDGSILAVSGSFGIYLYDADSMTEVLHVGDDCSGVVFSPDGGTLVTTCVVPNEYSGYEQTQFWNVVTGEMEYALDICLFSGDLDWAGAMSPDGSLLAIRAFDLEREDYTYGISLVNSADGTVVRQLIGHEDAVHTVAFSPDGSIVATSGEADITSQRIVLWDVESGQIIRTLMLPSIEHGAPGRASSLAFSPDGRYLLSGIQDTSGWRSTGMWLWDVTGGEIAAGPFGDTSLASEDTEVESVSYSYDGNLVASANPDRGTVVYEPLTAREVMNQDPAGRIVAFNPTRNLLASAGVDSIVRIWDPTTGELVHILTDHLDTVQTVAFSPDGALLASGHESGDVLLWDLASATVLHTLHVPGESQWVRGVAHYGAWDVTPVAFSPVEPRLASGFRSGKIWLWDTTNGELVYTIEAHLSHTTRLDFSPDGAILASGGWEETAVRLWQVSDGSLSASFPILEYCVVHGGLQFSPDGQLLAGVCGETVLVWRVSDGVIQQELEIDNDNVAHMVFSPDGQILAASETDGVRLWDTGDFSPSVLPMDSSEVVSSLVFSPDGQILAVGRRTSITLWQVSTQTVLTELTPRRNVAALAFSPDGALLVSGSTGGFIELWGVR